MKKLSLKVITEIMDGRVAQGNEQLVIENIATSVRKLRPGTLFFDLYHTKAINPHQYQANFAYAIITDRPASFNGLKKEITIIRVAKVNEAYWKFIDFYRNLFQIPVIGITGTCGKTTTKEMVKHLLAESCRVNATYKSYNALFRNLGYLLDIDETTEAAVFEMGVAYPNDLKISCRYFKPQVGIITNIGIDHLQAFETLDAYIKAKAEFLEGLGPEGTLILNADDENIKKIDLSKFAGNVIYFGFSDQAHFKISDPKSANGAIDFTLQHNNQTYRFSIPGYGEFNVYNATAAIAAVHTVGLAIQTAGSRLTSFQNVEKHFEFNKGINGSTIIDDTWSTNPTSVATALKLFKSLAEERKTIAVLGKMSLLGRQSTKYHWQIGERVVQIGIDRLIVIGEGAEAIGHGAVQSGMNPNHVHFCKDSAATVAILKKILTKNSIALVKTSMLASYTDLIDQIIVKT